VTNRTQLVDARWARLMLVAQHWLETASIGVSVGGGVVEGVRVHCTLCGVYFIALLSCCDRARVIDDPISGAHYWVVRWQENRRRSLCDSVFFGGLLFIEASSLLPSVCVFANLESF
jgi:hypothetical protein